MKTNEAVNLTNALKHKVTTKKLGGLANKLQELENTLAREKNLSTGQFLAIKRELVAVNQLIARLDAKPLPEFITQQDIDDLEDRLNEYVKVSLDGITFPESKVYDDTPVRELEKDLKKLRTELLSRINSKGGGQAHPQVNVNSSVVSTRYADLDFVAGANVTLTKSDNDTNKTARITIAASDLDKSAVWGSVAGTLSDQTDLQDELDLKAAQSTLSLYPTSSTLSADYTKTSVLLADFTKTSVIVGTYATQANLDTTNTEVTTKAAQSTLSLYSTTSVISGTYSTTSTLLASYSTSSTVSGTYAPKDDPTFTGTVTIPTPFTLGAVSVTPTGTELNFVDGVTSNIQTQLNARATTSTLTGSYSTTSTISGTYVDKPVNMGTDVSAFTSSTLAGVVTNETGSGALVFATSPALVTPALGTPASGVVTNLTGTASININGTVGATTPSTGDFTLVDVDNIRLDLNTISTTAGTDLNITPLAGQQIVLDGTIVIDAGVVTGATSITTTDLTVSNDINLALNSVINFGSGDVTWTYTSGVLTFDGGNLNMGGNIIVMATGLINNYSTTTDTGTALIITAGDDIRKSSSGDHFKKNQAPLDIDDAYALIESGGWTGYLDTDNPEVDEKADGRKKHWWLRAQAIHEALGDKAEQVIFYDEQGRPDSYDTSAVLEALFTAVKDLRARVGKLEGGLL